jgi:hypothetical protein
VYGDEERLLRHPNLSAEWAGSDSGRDDPKSTLLNGGAQWANFEKDLPTVAAGGGR